MMPESAEYFGIRGLVRISGSIDGYPFRGSFVAGLVKWIPVWVCAVVGLHFVPLSGVFRHLLLVPVGLLITIVAAAAHRRVEHIGRAQLGHRPRSGHLFARGRHHPPERPPSKAGPNRPNP